MKDVILFLLCWLLAGSIGLNIMWIQLDLKTMSDFKHWKERKKNVPKKRHYLTGFVLGLLLGPFTIKVKNEIRKR